MNFLRNFPFAIVAAALCLSGCKSGGQGSGQGGDSFLSGLANVAEAVGGKEGAFLAAGARTADAGLKAQEDFNDQNEYHIGRMASAQILTKYPLYNDDSANRYLNLVGKNLADFSNKPAVFAGYNFHVIQSDEINAFAMPGAYILVTRGLLRCAQNEDELAAILAHEIGHVQRRHAVDAIKNARGSDVWKTALVEFGKAGTHGKNYSEVFNMLSAGIGDMLKTVMVNGYSREQEAGADADAIEIMRLAGYDPNAMVSMLQRMKVQLKHDAHDFNSTHPSPDERIASVKKAIGGQVAIQPDAARTARFNEALKGVRAP